MDYILFIQDKNTYARPTIDFTACVCKLVSVWTLIFVWEKIHPSRHIGMTAIYHKQYRSRLFSWLNVAHCHTHTSSSKTQSSRYDVRDVTDVRVNKFSTGANHFKSQTFADVLRVRSSGCEVQLDKLENH